MPTRKIAKNEIPVIVVRGATEVGSPVIGFRVDSGMTRTERQLNAHIYMVAAKLEERLDAHGSGASVSVSAFRRRIVVEHAYDHELAAINEAIDEALELVGPMGVQIS